MVSLDFQSWQEMVTESFPSWHLAAYQGRAFVLARAIAWNFAIRSKLGDIRRHSVARYRTVFYAADQNRQATYSIGIR